MRLELSRMTVLGALVLFAGGCSHLATEDRYRSKVEVVRLAQCKKLDSLRRFEHGLFKAGFVRVVDQERGGLPVPFELVDHLLAGQPKLIEFRKSDFEAIKTKGSEPYREIVNRYKITACEEPGGGLYLIVVRHDPVTGDKFLGNRMQEALAASRCAVKPVAAPRDLGLYEQSTEDDLLRHVRRGLCRDYATGK